MFILRKLLYLGFFACLVMAINIWGIRISSGSGEDAISNTVNRASDSTLDRINKITTEKIEEEFGSSALNLQQSEIDQTLAQNNDAERASIESDSVVSNWISGQADKIDTSRIRSDLGSLVNDALSAVRLKVESLPPCQFDSEFISLEKATCRPSDSVLNSELARFGQDFINEQPLNVQPPWWMKLISTTYSLSGSFAYFILMVCAVMATAIVFSYSPNIGKGVKSFSRHLIWQSIVIFALSGISLIASSAAINSLGSGTILESLTNISGVKAWQNWQSSVLVLAAASAVGATILLLVSRMFNRGKGTRSQPRSKRPAQPQEHFSDLAQSGDTRPSQNIEATDQNQTSQQGSAEITRK